VLGAVTEGEIDMDKGTSGEARVHIDAKPSELYDLVSDVTRMGEWSPECVRCEWLDGATGPAVGARFRGSNRRGMARWSTKPTVVAAEPGKEFSFVVSHLGRDMTKWTYRFAEADGVTDATESFEMLASMPFYIRLSDRFVMGVKDRKADLEQAMGDTLNRIKAVAERSS
jgi:Polyketide cyclase / dehydrase and lipid transport